MCRKGLKRIGLFFLSVFLVLSLPVLSFADTLGTMEPEDYVFLTVFRACGVSPGVDVGRWTGLYKGYLRKTGNKALLSQVEDYALLGWGDTVQGMDALFESVKGWLSLSDSYGTEAVEYCLPSSPSPQLGVYSPPSALTSILTTPFPEVLPLEEPGYRYVFSEMWGSGTTASNILTNRLNFYAPDNLEIFAVIPDPSVFVQSDYSGFLMVYFYAVDASSPEGYSSVTLKNVHSTLRPDGSYLLPSQVFSVSRLRDDICSVMNYPFYVFQSAEDAEAYCKTGVAKNTFGSNSVLISSLGRDGGLDPDLQKLGLASIGSSMTLPSSREEAVTRAEAFQKPLSRQQLTDILNQNGMDDVAYMAEYQVEHYKKNADPDAQEAWTLADTEVFTGISGTEAEYSVKDYPNYLIDHSLTEPSDCKILPDGSLVVRLYYTPDPDAVYPYTVEYYKDGECFETVSKTVPMFGDRMVQDYEDFCPKYYLLDKETSTSLPFSVTEENHVIRVYYIPDTSNPYTPFVIGTENLVMFTSGFFGKVFLGIFVLLLLGLFINRILAFIKRTTSQVEEGKSGQKKRKKSYPRRGYTGRKGGSYKYRGRRKNYGYRRKGKKSRY